MSANANTGRARRAWRLPVALMIALGVIAGSTTTASATNWVGVTGRTGCGWGNQADNRTHTWYAGGLSSATLAAMQHTHSHINSSTILTAQRVFTATAATDQVIYDNPYTSWCGENWWKTGGVGGVAGYAQCVSTNAAHECEKHEVRISTTFINNKSAVYHKNLLTHETGHALGLMHRSVTTDVMWREPNLTITYSTHDKGHFSFL